MVFSLHWQTELHTRQGPKGSGNPIHKVPVMMSNLVVILSTNEGKGWATCLKGRYKIGNLCLACDDTSLAFIAQLIKEWMFVVGYQMQDKIHLLGRAHGLPRRHKTKDLQSAFVRPVIINLGNDSRVIMKSSIPRRSLNRNNNYNIITT